MVELHIPIDNPSSEQVTNTLHINTMYTISTQNITLPTIQLNVQNHNSQDLRELYEWFRIQFHFKISNRKNYI